MKNKIKAYLQSMALMALMLGPAAVDISKKALDLVMHFFGGPCIGH